MKNIQMYNLNRDDRFNTNSLQITIMKDGATFVVDQAQIHGHDMSQGLQNCEREIPVTDDVVRFKNYRAQIYGRVLYCGLQNFYLEIPIAKGTYEFKND